MQEKEGHNHIDMDSEEDPNYIAFQQAQITGQFDNLKEGTFVAFHNGQLVGTDLDKQKLITDLAEHGLTGIFIHEFGTPDTILHFRSPRKYQGQGLAE